jgi:hypothetical protein
MQKLYHSSKSTFFFPLLATIILFFVLTSTVNASTSNGGILTGLFEQLYNVLFEKSPAGAINTLSVTVSDTTNAQNPSEPPPPPPPPTY